ncbi:MAG: hypothetical protein ACRY3E_00485 [Candidatus Lariskella arthropodorum]
MKLHNIIILQLIFALMLLSGCSRDLSSRTYTSDTTLSLTFEGVVLSAKPVVIKEHDKLSGNNTGIAAGALAGGVAGSALGGNTTSILAGALIGGTTGAFIESGMGTAEGIEYIVKVDTSKLKDDYYQGSAQMREAIAAVRTSGIITVVQSKDASLEQGQKVYVIVSSKRARVIAR